MQLTEFLREEEGYRLRAASIAGVEWFVAKDVCDILEIKNHTDAVSALDADEKGVANSDTLGGEQTVTVINESGLYALIFRSRKPKAREFRKWVSADVLPAIRRTGGYQMMQAEAAPPNPVTHPVTEYIEAFDALRARGINPDKIIYSLGNVFQSSLAGAYQSHRQVMPMRLPEAPALSSLPPVPRAQVPEEPEPEGWTSVSKQASREGVVLDASETAKVCQKLRYKVAAGEVERRTKQVRYGGRGLKTVNLYPIEVASKAIGEVVAMRKEVSR